MCGITFLRPHKQTSHAHADTDNDGLPDCKDPCPGDGNRGQGTSCPVLGAGADASYFSVTPDCAAGTATVVYNRAPQLKTRGCAESQDVSWCGSRCY